MDIPVSNKIKVMDRLKTDYDKLKKPNESMENDNYKVQIQINKINKLIEKYNLNKIFGLNESKRDQIIDIESIQDLETVNIKLENYIDKGCDDQAREYIDDIYNNHYDKTDKVFDIIEHLNENISKFTKKISIVKISKWNKILSRNFCFY